MAATSMMKEYVKRQLKYWVDNFKDDQLPRDFNSKSFSRPQLMLHKITLKPDKIAALLRLPAPLIVTRATCSELVLKVPSWQQADKFVQEPLRLQLGDLFVDIKHIDECDDHVRSDAAARARAASLEPDPLGSIASMYQFATVITERLEVAVENVFVKVYERQALRLRVEMAHFHARTTNALWQDMRDLTDCVDRSPDGLLKTRFKFISAQCSVYLHETGGQQASSPPPLRLLHDHAIAMRATLFGHRKSKHDAWETLSRVVDLNLEILPFEMDTSQMRQVYEAYVTLSRWLSHTERGALLPHEMVRGPLTPKRKPTDGFCDSRNPLIDKYKKEDEKDIADEASGGGDSTFALQITVRFTAHALIRFHSERRGGDVQVAVIAQHAAVNWVQHQHDEANETQVTVHDVSVRHKDKVLFHAKPAREVLQFKRLPGNSLFVKWHLLKLECHLEKEIAVIVNEIFHSFNEVEQAATITCGTCHHKIRLDSIETHVCMAGTTPSPFGKGSATNGSRYGSSSAIENSTLVDSTQIPKLRLVFALDELEIVTDSFLFRSVQELMRLAADPDPSPDAQTPQRRFVVQMKEWSVSTESKEFVGDAIFVPVLPLAFQMLECTIRGCGCVHEQQKRQRERGKHKPDDSHDSHNGDHGKTCSHGRQLPRWPDRVFAELGHLSVKATQDRTNTETFVVADGTSLRLSFSDGVSVCPHSTPQMSCYFHVERIRCQLEHDVYQRVRDAVAALQNPLQGRSVSALTLFFAVTEIRNVELTLLHKEADTDHPARLKTQLRHVGGVADNHQGHLSLQTNFDFRALLHSESVTFDFQAEKHVAEAEAEDPAQRCYVSKRERQRQREQEQRANSARRIQRTFRRFATERRVQLAQVLRRLTREDEEHGQCASFEVREPLVRESESIASPSTTQRKSSRSVVFGSGDDLAAISPMKMVAAAGVLKDGVFGFVRAKGQRLESEMTELAMQSKESASRFMPKYSAVKNLLSPKAGGGGSPPLDPVERKTTEVREVDPEERGPQVPGDGDDEEEEQLHGEAGEKDELDDEVRPPSGENSVQDEEQDGDLEEQEGPTTPIDDMEEERVDDNDPEEEEKQESPTETTTVQADAKPPLSATEALLASLPPVVRLMVQVEEHRICVPIDPRATVAFFCREIVRRFNEMFANHGVIAHVTLQSAQGGVFAGSDVVGLVCDAGSASPELLFAYPHAEDAEIKSVVHINHYDSPGKPAATSGAHSAGFRPATSAKVKKSGREFTRCSKLPLPLVVALLANETERALLSHMLSHDGGRDEWPELALNASFLDPTREMLQVEVRWQQGKSLQVANHDAFLLCLQQLGLCTSRENSKHVGKILRDRLKMDAKNPLIRAACRESPEFQADVRDDGEVAATSYESLKEIVQEDFGVYTRLKE